MSNKFASKRPQLTSHRRTTAWSRSRTVAAFPVPSCCAAALCAISRSRRVSIASTSACRRRRKNEERPAKVFPTGETAHGEACEKIECAALATDELSLRFFAGSQNLGRREGHGAQPHTNRVKHGIADRGGYHCRRRLTGTPRHLIGTVDQIHHDLGDFGEPQYGITGPIHARDSGLAKQDLFLEHPAYRLHHIALDLIA